MAEPDWFMNLLYWWVYQFLQGIIIQWIGFWFAVFSDYDWGRVTMNGIGTDLPIMSKVQEGMEAGAYGA